MKKHKSEIKNPFLFTALKDVNKFRKLLQNKSESFWWRRGEKMREELFKEMKKSVPAFHNFLKENNLLKEADFDKIIPCDKNNYLRENNLSDLCWDGDLAALKGTISATSGSTGEPFYFPRSSEQDLLYSLTAELYLLENFQIDKKSTLYINAFALGPWIGGVFTYNAITKIQERANYKLNIINTSINRNDLYAVIKKMGNLYEQIIIGCYPPLLKDILDCGIDEGIDWKKFNLKFVFSAEGFSEDFRKYIFNVTGMKQDENYFLKSLNHYGTVDLGTQSYETPICILLRTLAIKNDMFFKKIFNLNHKLPTLTQFIPEHFYFEEEKGKNNVVGTSYSGLPLFRYDLKDNGGVLKFSTVNRLVKKYFGKSLNELATQNGIEQTLWQLPFVYVYERADLSIKLFGFEIFPETIKNAIISDSQVYGQLSGRFTIEAAHDDKFSQYLKVNVELKKHVSSSQELKDKIKNLVIKFLLKENYQYHNAHKLKSGNLEPVIELLEHEHPAYFKSGGKQKWAKKN